MPNRQLAQAVKAVHFLPPPIQKPRLPALIGGRGEAALQRASRWDGWIMGSGTEKSEVPNPPEKLSVKLRLSSNV